MLLFYLSLGTRTARDAAITQHLLVGIVPLVQGALDSLHALDQVHLLLLHGLHEPPAVLLGHWPRLAAVPGAILVLDGPLEQACARKQGKTAQSPGSFWSRLCIPGL